VAVPAAAAAPGNPHRDRRFALRPDRRPVPVTRRKRGGLVAAGAGRGAGAAADGAAGGL